MEHDGHYMRDGERRLNPSEGSRRDLYIVSFLFHPKNYYKLSLRVTSSNTFDNLYKS